MSLQTGISLLAAFALITGLTLYLRKPPAPGPQPQPLSEPEQIVSALPEPEHAETVSPTPARPETNHAVPAIAAVTPSADETPQQQAFKKFLDKMSRHSELLHEEFHLLEQLSGMHPSENENTNHLVFAKMREAFAELGRTASTNADALQLLVDASKSKYLEGVAVAGIGVAAENGNERAIGLLLDPESGWLLSGSAGALVKVAQSGNEQAIEFMYQLTQDESKRALWGFATTALAHPAESGNEQAIAGLVNISADAPTSIRNEVAQALKNAAANGSQSAALALKQMADSNREARP